MSKTEIATFVSELLAAAAIVVSAGAYCWDYFYASNKVSVSLSTVSSTSSDMSLLISNTGQIDIAIKRIFITVPDYKDINNEVVIEKGGIFLPKQSSILLKSQKSNLSSSVRYEKKSSEPSVYNIQTATTDCLVNVEIVASSEKSTTTPSTKMECIAASVVDWEQMVLSK
ncbi:hypothetical protein ECA3945 [Pectobacterium atrosepticum SCRI1043]|uniref:Uncharacterized protein n=1 Tax=Pectobacterium atrosepticum (strain SCRI 1043 / ATCC BAA-672) TaxID=218491 RepID=Q6D056_PECAS|nr:hypothetical protein [Pectobacterium atrosepticum]GKV87030.1 hypothetical protein PEC301296_33410 [Pectobacterium carotovorum subsp. carotovorum]MCL6317581.1 hypothetical protein [Pectobacterium atrosepticum]MCL6322526.1 hypothetical protein [Pectobacterium atrosepticum]MCL6391595.1 hypothetical protein [Pectobacterium atrosepticum]MDK9443991.1 hypothetical protein [Pectobacterium atrosepticum]